MAEPIVEQVFTVSRDGKAITSYQPTVEAAAVDMAKVQDAMRAAMLTPDVQLATVEKTTTYADPVPVKG